MDQGRPQRQGQFDLKRALAWLGLILLGIVLAALFWFGGKVLLLGFAGILLAVVLRAPMGVLVRWTGMPDKLAYTLVLVLILLFLVGFGWLVGPSVLNQAGEFRDRVPQMVEDARTFLQSRPWGRWIVDQLGVGGGDGGAGAGGGAEQSGQAGQDGGGRAGQSGAAGRGAQGEPGGGEGGQAGSGGAGGSGRGVSDVASSITGIARTISVTLANLALVLVLGLFLAVNPDLYRRGVVRLFPAEAQQRAAEVVDELGRTLKYWLVGQLALMFITGVLTGIGLVILGIPLALALAFFVALMEFIPFVGPILGFIPIVMMAATQGSSTVLWVLLLYLAIQQIEGNIFTPLIQQQAVSLPPALTVGGVFLGGALFGPLGVILGTPLLAVVYVLVKMLYVHDALGQGVQVPGKTEAAP